MKFGIISDIHGNIFALNAVIHELQNNHSVDKIICCGDIIGIAGYPSECIETVREHCEVNIKGNHDAFPLTGYVSTSEVVDVEKQLFNDNTTEEQQSWLYKLPSYKHIPEYNMVIAHSIPNQSESLGLEDGNAGVRPRDFTAYMSEVDAKYVALGHTHTQHKLNGSKFGHNVLMINPGSVGDVYQTEAEYAILDTDADTVTTHTVSYDTAKVTERIKEIENTYQIKLL